MLLDGLPETDRQRWIIRVDFLDWKVGSGGECSKYRFLIAVISSRHIREVRTNH
jgi:hypothetical protein